jgi:membrane protein implicated in regulation of membrane protease activity
MQWLLFSVLSVLSLLLFRRPLLSWIRRHEKAPADVDRITGEIAFPAEDIAPGATGRAQLRGTVWTARNVSTNTLVRGQRCLVLHVDGLTLSIGPEGA